MLHYLWDVTQTLFISVTMMTLLLAMNRSLNRKACVVIQWTGITVGLIGAAVRAIMHNMTAVFDTRINLWLFYLGLPPMLLLLVLCLFFCRRNPSAGGQVALSVCSAWVSADLLIYKAWKTIQAPVEFETGGNGILSAEFALRLAGWLLALIILAVYARFLYRCCLRLVNDPNLWHDAEGKPGQRDGYGVLRLTVSLEMLSLMTVYYGLILRTWRTSPKLYRLSFAPVMPFEGKLAMYVGNNTAVNSKNALPFIGMKLNMPFFLLLVGLIALIPPVVLFVRSLKLRGVWEHPAGRRRLVADNRHNRRWAAVTAVCALLMVLNLTVVYAIDNRVETPPDSEIFYIEDGAGGSVRYDEVTDEALYALQENGDNIIRIPITQVDDYALHAFEMKTKDAKSDRNVTVRWIIIKKPNSGAYGVGLDACDVCGNAGYIQRGDTVVCKKCDVVMNTSTIGLAGGCNPIPLSFKVESGAIVIRMADLMAAQKEFR